VEECCGDDEAESSSVLVERGAAVAERDCVQPAEPAPAASAAGENRQLVCHHVAAAIGEVGWRIHQASSVYWLPLAKSQPTRRLFAGHGTADRCITLADWIGAAASKRVESGRGTRMCLGNRFRIGQFLLFLFSERARQAPP
jgi:hypothetical protein